MRYLSLVLTLLAAAATPAAAERLPLLAAPEHYDLHFMADLQKERFEGRETIRLRILAPTRKLVLHAAGLEFTAARVVTGAIEQRAVVSVDAATETVTFHLPVDLTPGIADLHVSYSGALNRELRGFYITEANGRKYAATQLEATDARRMFPAFDEPRYKATFDVSVVVAEHDSAISNGAIEFIRPGPADGTKTIDFTTTPRMSSYLVALAIGDFECLDDRLGQTPVRVCATPGKKLLMRFAMDATKASLDYLNRCFAIDYPFRKLDMVAIPDFAAGAMENTGAVFFREALLLVAPDAALSARRRAALVIAHELAHQWFGNLVTMRWWDDLWLNEGFATWMETKAVAAWQPDWNVELDERESIQGAMAIDALQATRPVRMRAETPDEINELFDPIAYEKAAAVLSMVEAYVGEDAFRHGVNAYVHEHQYDNASAENFWNLMTRATGQPVDRIMRSFVEQPGVPLVTVGATCDGNTTTVTLSQDRFLALGSDPQSTATWAIPVCVGTRGDAAADRCELLDNEQESIRFPGCARWVLANSGAEGYFRTQYNPAALDRLSEANAALRPEERLMLIADTWALLRARRGDIGAFLDLMSSLATDIDEPAVLEATAARLQFIHEYVASRQTRDTFERWVRAEFAPLVGPATAPGTRSCDGESARARAVLLALVGGVGRDPEVIADARTVVEDHLASPAPGVASPTVLNVLVPVAAREGGAGLYEKYRARAETAETPEERYRFLYGLAAFREPDLLRQTFEYALSRSVRTQDRAALIAALLGSPVGRDVVWPLMQARWNELQRDLGAFGGTGRIVEALGAFCDRGRLDDIRRFFATHPVPAAARTLRQTFEDVDTCAALAESRASELQRWLAGDTEHRNVASRESSSKPGVTRQVSAQRAEVPVPVPIDQIARRAGDSPGLLASVHAVIVSPFGPRTFTIRDPQFLDPDGDALVVMGAPLIVAATEQRAVRVIGRLYPAVSHDDALRPPVDPLFSGEAPALPVIVAESVTADDSSQLAMHPDASAEATTLSQAAGATKSDLAGRLVDGQSAHVLQVREDEMFWVVPKKGAAMPRLLVVPAKPVCGVEAGDRVDVRGILLPLPRRFANTLRDGVPVRDEPLYLYATDVRVK